MSKLQAYYQLIRADKPIGSYLLLWPTLWALWIAAQGIPDGIILAIFVAGVFVMRSAGCIINDFADRNFDGHVERTKQRPLVSGALSVTEALSFFAILIAIAFVLVWQLGLPTVMLSVVALVLAASYPFMKRVMSIPQLVLGAAFSWSIPMAAMATLDHLPVWCWWLFVANLCWTMAYDTFYALVDIDDDRQIGVRSSALFFGQHVQLAIVVLQAACIITLCLAFYLAAVPTPSYLAIVVAMILFVSQHWRSREATRSQYFAVFLQNHYVGAAVFVGLAAGYWLG